MEPNNKEEWKKYHKELKEWKKKYKGKMHTLEPWMMKPQPPNHKGGFANNF